MALKLDTPPAPRPALHDAELELRLNPRRLPAADSPWLASALAGAEFPADAASRLAEAGGEIFRLDRATPAEADALEAAARRAGVKAVRGGPGRSGLRAAIPDEPCRTSGSGDPSYAVALAGPPLAWAPLVEALRERPLGELIADTRRRYARRTFDVPTPRGSLRLGPGAAVMGILNVTPDSFSDGGRFPSTQAAVDHALRMAEAGAALIDVGGESTRPGAEPVAEAEELRRVLPVVEALAGRHGLFVSVDTSKARVAEEACAAGARMVNDVAAFAGDPRMPEAVARAGVPVVLMHMRGTPRTMQDDPAYADVMGEVTAFLRGAIARARAAGVPEEAVLVDPGFGFGKRLGHNVELLARLAEFRSLGRPIVVGTSRKRFLGDLTGRPVDGRAFGTAAGVAAAVLAGAAIVRVHDAAEMADVAKVASALAGPSEPPDGNPRS